MDATELFEKHYAAFGLPRDDTIRVLSFIAHEAGVSPSALLPGALIFQVIDATAVVDSDYSYLLDATANWEPLSHLPLWQMEEELLGQATFLEYTTAVLNLLEADAKCRYGLSPPPEPVEEPSSAVDSFSSPDN